MNIPKIISENKVDKDTVNFVLTMIKEQLHSSIDIMDFYSYDAEEEDKYEFRYKGKTIVTSIDSKLVRDTIYSNKKSLAGRYSDGGEAGFNDAGTSMVMYHEKQGNWLVPKGQVYLYLYDVEDSASKLGNEFDWVFYPLTSQMMAFQRDYIPPLKKIWTKKFQKEHKGSEHLLGVIKAFLIDKDGKQELYIDMMSVNPNKKKKGIMSYMIKDLRNSFNLTQDQVTFSKLTPEGEKFVAKKTYDDGGETSGLITDEQVKDLSFKIKIKNVPLKKGVLLHQIITLEEFDLPDEENVNFYPFHLIYGDSSLAIFDAFGVDEVAGLKRKECEEFINNLKAEGKTEKDDSFIAGLTNYVGDKLFMFFNVERLSYEGFANRVLPHEALHLSRNLISLFKNKWLSKNLNTPNWWEDKRASFVDMDSENEEFFAETLERTTAIAMDGWFKVTGQKCFIDKNKTYEGGGGLDDFPKSFKLKLKRELAIINEYLTKAGGSEMTQQDAESLNEHYKFEYSYQASDKALEISGGDGELLSVIEKRRLGEALMVFNYKLKMNNGGGVDENNYRISISENDKYIGEYPNPIGSITEAKTIFVQLATKYKRPQYLISVSLMPTSTSGYEKINVDEWYNFSESFKDGGGVKDIYIHKYNPNITLEVIELTSKGVKGVQKNPKSLSKKEKKEGIIVNYSDAELKELFEQK